MADENQQQDAQLGQMTDFEKWEADEAAGVAKMGELGKKPAPAPEAEDMPPPVDEDEPKQQAKAEADEVDEPEEKPKKARGGFQRKLEARDRTIAEQQEIIASLQGKRPPPKHPDDMTLEEQIEAKVEERIRVREAERDADAANRRFRERCDEIREEHEDFDEIMAEANELIPATSKGFAGVNQRVLNSPKGAALVYWLGTHPKDAQRIAGLDPFEAVAELAKIEATKLDSAGEKSRQLPDSATSKTPPRGPKPVSSIANRAEGSDEPDPANFPKWEEWFDKQQAKKKAGTR